MKIIALFLFVFSRFIGVAQEEIGLSNATKNRIDSIIEMGRSQIKLPGVSVVIMRGNKTILAKGYGFADREKKIPASASTIYPIASISKHFTAAAIMKLVEAGKLNLDDAVAKYLPEYQNVTTPVLRVRHLLQQTSGIPEWNTLPEMEGVNTSHSDSFGLAKIIEVLGRQKQMYPPGYWWSYSNSNYSLLAAILEKVSGETYQQFLNRNFFLSLQLNSTASFEPEKSLPPGSLAIGYLTSDDSYEIRLVSTTKAHAYTGSGGLCSNALDLASWMRSLVMGNAITKQSFHEMTTASTVGAGFIAPYGFGLSLKPIENQPAIWHAGVLGGYTSVLLYLPKEDLTIAMLTNSRHALLEYVVRSVTRELLHLQAPAILDLPLNAALIKRSIGNYDDSMFKFSIVEKSGHLFLDVPDLGNPMQLYYQGENEFVTAEPAMIHLWCEPSNGVAEKIIWDWAELRAYGRRVY